MSNELFFNPAKELVDSFATLYATESPILSQLKGTAERIARMYSEFCWEPDEIERELNKCFRVFDNGFDEMLVVKDIHVWTLCPHHLLPCEFKVYIGYMPNGKVLGLSKFSRIADILARKPVMQEQYTSELVDLLMTRLKPRGAGVTIYGIHGCMTARGVKQHAEVVTSVVRGMFLQHASIKQEFLAVCRENK